jgi:hypothetical protein
MKGADWSPGNDDQQIWYTTTADGHTFADQAIVPGALTVSKPALAALPGTGLSLPPGPCVPAPSASLDTVPSTGAGRDLMLMAVQAVQGLDDEYVATSAFDGTRPHHRRQRSGPGLGGRQIRSPTAELLLAGTGPRGQNIWWQRYARGSWGTRQPIDGIGTRTFRPSSSPATRPADLVHPGSRSGRS